MIGAECHFSLTPNAVVHFRGEFDRVDWNDLLFVRVQELEWSMVVVQRLSKEGLPLLIQLVLRLLLTHWEYLLGEWD